MRKSLVLLLPLVVCLGACNARQSSPLAPTATSAASPGVPAGGTNVYPGNGPDLIAFISNKYPERLAGGISLDQRVENMKFLRDRIIEAGKCGGMDLGWNLKRGGPDVSIDFITERRDGTVYGHDIAMDYDNPSRPLQLYWGDGEAPFYAEYPAPSCQ